MNRRHIRRIIGIYAAVFVALMIVGACDVFESDGLSDADFQARGTISQVPGKEQAELTDLSEPKEAIGQVEWRFESLDVSIPAQFAIARPGQTVFKDLAPADYIVRQSIYENGDLVDARDFREYTFTIVAVP